VNFRVLKKSWKSPEIFFAGKDTNPENLDVSQGKVERKIEIQGKTYYLTVS